MSIDRSIATRFWAKVERNAADECWPWAGYTPTPTARRLSYGYFYLTKTKKVRAHRVAYELSVGEIPEGLFVCHRCDNPRCCNPAHLWLGTAAENNADRDAKGRAGPPPGGKPNHGEVSPPLRRWHRGMRAQNFSAIN